MKKLITTFLLSIFIVVNSYAQLIVNNAAPYNSAAYLVNNVLSGNGVVASNVTFSGQAAQIGFFKSGLTGSPILGLDSGIVMSSGDVNDIPPGGNQPDQGQYSGPEDADLLTIAQSVTSNPQAGSITSTNDAAILEFDFVPVGDSVFFRFVFASEEYNTYINTQFNDVFAFFLSGPGITGPYASPAGFPNGAVNVALVPGTNDPITISTIYNDPTQTPPSMNPQYYINNQSGTNNDFNAFTTVITAKYPVQCGELYHFKFAIADCQDDYLDTGVFIEAGSLTSSGVGISAQTPFPNNTIVEGCGDALITVSRSDTSYNDTINLNILGNATANDFSSFPTQIIYAPGATDTTFSISGLIDNTQEGTDTLIIEILGNTGCNMVTIYIEDYIEMEVSVSDSVNICSDLGETAEVYATVTGGLPPYLFDWYNDIDPNNNIQGDTIVVSPESTTFYVPTVYDACGNDVSGDQVPVWVQCPVIPINIFTPNGDGVNDYFELVNLDDYTQVTVEVYDRWGNMVYESFPYKNDWDGTNKKNGKPLSDGTYFYIVKVGSEKYEYKNNSKGEGEFKYTVNGYVTIVR
ncbi:MAG: hypothetical protein Kow0079_06710 [Vicingaceae bacterium]